MVDRTGWCLTDKGRPCEACERKLAELELWADGRILYLTARDYIVRLHRAKDELQSKSGNLYFAATLDKDVAKSHFFVLKELPEAVADLKTLAKVNHWKRKVMAKG